MLETGLDEDGQAWPFWFASYIDPKPAVFSWFQIVSSLLFGQNLWAARLPSAVLGIGSIWLLYWLFRRWVQNMPGANSTPFLVTVLIAISPWHIVLTRGTQEVIASLFFGLLALAALEMMWSSTSKSWVSGFFSKKLPKKIVLHPVVQTLLQTEQVGVLAGKLGWFLLFFVSGGTSVYMYHSSKIVLPLLVILLTWWRHESLFEQRWQQVLSVSAGVILTGAVASLLFFHGGSTERFQDVSVFSHGPTVGIVNEQIATSTGILPQPIIRVFHNKVVNAGWQIAQTYFEHFSVRFLFLEGGQPGRYSIAFHGLLYGVELPLLILGLSAAFQTNTRQRRFSWFMIAWLLISPLPAALTTHETPSMIRSFWMMIPLYYFIALGWISFWNWALAVRSAQKRMTFSESLKKPSVGLLLLAQIWFGAYFVNQYFIQAPRYHPWQRNYADQAMAEQLATMHQPYEKVVISRFNGQPYVYVALAGLISPQDLQQSYPARFEPDFTIGKYQFVDEHCPLEYKANTLFVVREMCELQSQTTGTLELEEAALLNLNYLSLTKTQYLDGNDGYQFVVWQGTESAELKSKLTLSAK